MAAPRFGMHSIECELRTRATWPPLGPCLAWLCGNLASFIIILESLAADRLWLGGITATLLYTVNSLFVPIVLRAFRAAGRRSTVVVQPDRMTIRTVAGLRKWSLDDSIECVPHPGGLFLACADDSIYIPATAHPQSEIDLIAQTIEQAAKAALTWKAPEPPEPLLELTRRS